MVEQLPYVRGSVSTDLHTVDEEIEDYHFGAKGTEAQGELCRPWLDSSLDFLAGGQSLQVVGGLQVEP
jgi:hypothetical protein